MKNFAWAIALTAGAMGLSGCERVDDETAATGEAEVDTTSRTLSSALTDADELSATAHAFEEADLVSVFDGAGSYTVLAPTDDAFAALGDRGEQLRSDDDPAPLVALLRGHIVTGYLRPEDLRTALKDDDDGEVSMATVGTDPVVFAMDGDDIVVRGADGSQARLLIGEATEAENGVLIPVDGILRKFD